MNHEGEIFRTSSGKQMVWYKALPVDMPEPYKQMLKEAKSHGLAEVEKVTNQLRYLIGVDVVRETYKEAL